MSIFGPFHSFLIDEAYDTVLLNLELCQYAQVHRGQGRFVCNPNGQQSFWGITEVSEQETVTPRESLQIGAMIPEAGYLNFKARNRAGQSISAKRMFDQGGEIRTNPRVWNYGTPVAASVEVEYPASPGTYRTVQSIFEAPHLRECFQYWAPNDSDSKFTIRAKGLFGAIEVHFLKAGRILLNCDPSESGDLDRTMDAASLAIGFVSGRPIIELVRKISTLDTIIERIVYSASKFNRPLWTPFGPEHNQREFSPAAWELLIAKSIDYFLLPESKQANPQLTALWNSVDRSFSVSALVACSVLEGLCNQCKEPVPTVLTESQLKMIRKLIETDEFAKAGVVSSKDPNGIPVSSRIMNALSPLNSKNATNLLSMWCESGKYGLSKTVFEGRRSLRNRPAHGHFDLLDAEVAERAKLIAHRNAVYQGINSILLSRMGYDGPYFDWITGSVKEPAKSGTLDSQGLRVTQDDSIEGAKS